MKMRRLRRGTLLAGVSASAILMMTAGLAWAGSGDGLSLDTSTGTMTNANSGTSYSSGTLNINGTQTGTGTQDGVWLGGNGSAIPSLTVNVGANVTGGSSLAGPGTPLGLNIYSTGGSFDINILQGVTVSGPVGNGIAINDSTVNSITNRGAIVGSSRDNTNAIGVGNGSGGVIRTLTNYGVITSSADNPTISVFTNGSITTINNESGGVISNTGGNAAISLNGMTNDGTINNSGTISGNIILGVGGTHTVNLNSGSSLTGDISGNGSAAYVNVGASGSGISTFTGEIGNSRAPIQSVTIRNGATLAFGGDSTINAGALNFANGGTLDFGSNEIDYRWFGSVGSSETHSGTSYFKTTIDTNAQKHGYLVISIANGNGGTTLFSSGAPIIVPTVVGSVTSGAKYVVVQDVSGRTALNLPTVVNSGGYHWTVSSVTGTGQTDTDGVSYGTGYTDIVLTNGGTNAAGNASGTNGAAINALASYSGSNSQLQALSQAINNLTSDADIQKAGAQLRPEINGGTTQASLGAVNQALGTIQVRTEAVRTSASDQTGVSSGETAMGLGTWAQGFGSHATQDRREGVDGYGANTYGLAIGADTLVFDSLRAGASLAYARTNVADTGARDGSGQKISSYIATLYGTYTAPRWYVDGTLTYGRHDYDSTRLISIVGASTEVAKASFSGQQYGAKTEFGYPIALGDATVTPIASLAYNRLNQDGYTETGAAAALTVGSSSTDSIRSGLGSKVSASIGSVEGWSIRPNARAVWLHEFNGKAQDSTSTFVEGGSSFTTSGIKIAQEHFDIGLGLDLVSLRNTTISAKYDADLSDRYVSHTGSVQIRTEF